MQIKVEGEVVAESTITDANLIIDGNIKTLGITPIGTSALTGEDSGTDIDLYRYVFRVPCYVM